jgi:cytochrome c-type biogenesis protein CcmH/NrfF
MIRIVGLGVLVTRALRALPLAAALVLFVAAGGEAQSSAVAPAGGAPRPGHYHEGLTGEQWLIIEHDIKCLCSCGLDVHSCQFQMRCDTSPGWSQRIRRDLEAGMSKEAIEASFVADFGSQVLLAPPPEGFNLVGYLLPGITILLAGALVGLLARGGMRREVPATVTEVGDEDAERLRAEWQRLDRAESPDW